jgi:predicted RNA-binding Zn-ribbon protein involved in translation (DUF1610 family)
VPRVMIVCQETGRDVSTGIELAEGSHLTGHAARVFQCPACGKQHAVRRPFFENIGPTAFDKYWVALDRRPLIAAEIGVLISCAATVEWYLPQLIMKFGVGYPDALIVAGYFQSFSVRIDLLQAIAKTRDPNDPITEAIQKFIPRMREANAIRNKYAHAQYGLGATEDSIVIMPFSGDAKKKDQTHTETIDDVVGDVNFLKALCSDLSDFIVAQQKTPPPSISGEPWRA